MAKNSNLPAFIFALASELLEADPALGWPTLSHNKWGSSIIFSHAHGLISILVDDAFLRRGVVHLSVYSRGNSARERLRHSYAGQVGRPVLVREEFAPDKPRKAAARILAALRSGVPATSGR